MKLKLLFLFLVFLNTTCSIGQARSEIIKGKWNLSKFDFLKQPADYQKIRDELTGTYLLSKRAI